MRVSALVHLANVDGIDFIEPVFLGERLADVVVEPVDAALHVCVLFDAPVAVVEIVAKHIDGSADERVDFARAAALFAIENVCLGGLCVAGLNENLFHEVLNALDVRRVVAVAFLSKANDLVG